MAALDPTAVSAMFVLVMASRKPTCEQLSAAVGSTIPDVLRPGLDVVFDSINPGLYVVPWATTAQSAAATSPRSNARRYCEPAW